MPPVESRRVEWPDRWAVRHPEVAIPEDPATDSGAVPGFGEPVSAITVGRWRRFMTQHIAGLRDQEARGT